jgi:hypothetical protein
MAKKIVLLSISILAVSFFFVLPENREWLTKRVFTYWKDFQNQKAHLGLEVRKVKRYGNDYSYSKQIADSLKLKARSKDALVLVPPTAYFKAKGIDYHVPEPAVFYYYTGVKTVWINSEQAAAANWFVHADASGVHVDSISNFHNLSDTIKAFKKFPVSL